MPDLRRYLRPFFLDPKTQAPLPSKKYYDFFSWLVTQLTFSFATAPFLILSFSGSLTAWSRLYFYAVIGTLASMGFFASPAKPAVRHALEQRAARAGVATGSSSQPAKGSSGGAAPARQPLARTTSTDSVTSRAPVLGLSADPEQDFGEALMEIRAEVEARRAEFEARRASMSKPFKKTS